MRTRTNKRAAKQDNTQGLETSLNWPWGTKCINDDQITSVI